MVTIANCDRCLQILGRRTGYVNPVLPEVTTKNSLVRVNNKNYFGTEDGRQIELNSFKGHYFIQEKSKYSASIIKYKYVMKKEVDEANY